MYATISRAGYLLGAVVLLAAGAGTGLAAAADDPNPASIHSAPGQGAWPLYRQWTPAEVQHYGRWIAHLYAVKTTGTPAERMARIEEVLTSPRHNLLLDDAFRGTPSNPQLPVETMRAMHAVLDCGKLTQALGAYYAYRRGLPWMVARIRSGDGEDIRRSGWNVVTGQNSSFEYDSLHAFFVDATYGFCTGNYRIDPHRGNPEQSDTVPVALTRDALTPGVMWYLDGHVLILAGLDAYGEPRFMDSTVDKARDIYTHNGFNAVTGLTPAGEGDDALAGCYRGFRQYRFPIAETTADGKVIDVRRRTDAEMAPFGFDLEQYHHMRRLQADGVIVEDGLPLDSFHELMRLRLATAPRLDVQALIEREADRLLARFQRREEVVQRGWQSVQQEGPIVFPARQGSTTVFNARGRWGEYSTAALDLSDRLAYYQLLDQIDAALQWYDNRPDYIVLPDGISDAFIWSRADLAHLLGWLKKRAFEARTMTYTNAAGEPVTLPLLDIEARLFDLSFDPNHPPELRWGAAPGSVEAAHAPAMSTPLPDGETVAMAEAYQAQRYYRLLLRPDPEESYLLGIASDAWPEPARLDALFATWKRIDRSPPLVPAMGRTAWVAAQRR